MRGTVMVLVCVRDVLYVIAGWGSNNKTKSLHYLETKHENWQHGPDLPCVMIWPKVSSVNDRVYVLDPETRQFWGLDFDRNVWVETSIISRSMRWNWDDICEWEACGRWRIWQYLCMVHSYHKYMVQRPADKGETLRWISCLLWS